jgi:hypothetical protein
MTKSLGIVYPCILKLLGIKGFLWDRSQHKKKFMGHQNIMLKFSLHLKSKSNNPIKFICKTVLGECAVLNRNHIHLS